MEEKEKELKEQLEKTQELFKQQKIQWREQRSQLYKRVFDNIKIDHLLVDETVHFKGESEQNEKENPNKLTPWKNKEELQEEISKKRCFGLA